MVPPTPPDGAAPVSSALGPLSTSTRSTDSAMSELKKVGATPASPLKPHVLVGQVEAADVEVVQPRRGVGIGASRGIVAEHVGDELGLLRLHQPAA
jgi:hypothetical protein